MNEAKDKYLANCMNSETCENSSDIVIEESGGVSCKAEPPELIEYVENSQPIEMAFETSAVCPLEDEEFAPEATIDQRDFDAIFLEEFATDCDIKLEKSNPVERYMDHTEALPNTSSTYAPEHEAEPSDTGERISAKTSTATNYTPKVSLKRHAETSRSDLICDQCAEPFLSLNEAKLHYKEKHYTPDETMHLIAKRVKR